MPTNLFNLNNPDFWGIMIRFVINLIFLYLLVVVVYYRYSRKEKFVFSFFLMGIMIFFIGSMLKTVFMEIGMAVGLFAIFTILRLRTRSFTIKDMSYIFVTIGLSVINSLKLIGFPVLGVVIINLMIIITAWVLEVFLVNNNYESHSITYNNMELLKPDKEQKLLKDISSRTGKDITKVRIRNIDFKNENATLDIYYKVANNIHRGN
jgi:hypothetical protein